MIIKKIHFINKMYFYAAPQYFFQNARLNIYQGNIAINLMNLFPLLKQGYASFKDSATIIFNIYVKLNNLVDPTDITFIIPDELINEAFNGIIPAKKLYDPKTRNFIDMNDAVNDSLILTPLNTFHVMNLLRQDFDPFRLHKETVTGIFGLLWLNSNDTNLTNLKTELSHEFLLLVYLSSVISRVEVTRNELSRDTTLPITFKEFASAILKYKEPNSNAFTPLLESLTVDPWVKLLYAIITEDIKTIQDSTLDFRINNNEAYKLALEIGDPAIIKLIENKMIERQWYIEQALTNVLETLATPSSLVRDIFRTRF